MNSMGIDELTPCGPSEVVEVTPGGMKRYSLQPGELGLSLCTLEDLKGGDAAVNAALLMDVFGGSRGPVSGACPALRCWQRACTDAQTAGQTH